ncbi:CD109 antigen-like [Protopterus annectens]|uniref:CD109 antigen-like n=1 Tax=Protopterus annectens TaxID=7888 RepID=UPI001CFBD24E|nr:CD109 antigen-like [Protopterus annectens]
MSGTGDPLNVTSWLNEQLPVFENRNGFASSDTGTLEAPLVDILKTLDHKSLKVKKLQLEISYFNECKKVGVVPKGLRSWQYPTGLIAGSEFHSELISLFDRHGHELMDLMAKFYQKFIDQLSGEIEILDTNIKSHVDFNSVQVSAMQLKCKIYFSAFCFLSAELLRTQNHKEPNQVSPQNEVFEYKLEIKGFSGKKLLFTRNAPLRFVLNKISVFIQTDKSVYKGGHTVKFRILSLFPDLRPCPDKHSISVSEVRGCLRYSGKLYWIQLHIEKSGVQGEEIVNAITVSTTLDRTDELEIVAADHKMASKDIIHTQNNFFIYNYTDVEVNQEYFNLFIKGFTFVPLKRPGIEDILLDIKPFNRKLNLRHIFKESVNKSNVDALKKFSTYNPPLQSDILNFERCVTGLIREGYKKQKILEQNLTKEENVLLYELSNNDNLRIMKPDKGGGVVLMDTWDYTKRMFDILDKDNRYMRVSRNEVNISYRKTDLFLEDNLLQDLIDVNLYNFLKVMKPVIPVISGIPKIHKDVENPPLRPIVSSQGSKTQPLAIYIDSKLKAFYKNYSHILIDSWDFLTKIGSNIYKDDTIFLTVDIIDLFSVIPHNIGLDWFEKMIVEMKILTQDDFKVVLENMELVLKYNYIYFQGELYHQIDSVAMGSACAHIYANIIMLYWERQYIFNSMFYQYITDYYRFLDDIFILWDGPEQEIINFMNYINNTTEFLKFTSEQDAEEIHYLDVKLKKDHVNRKYKSRIYRKDCHSNSYLHFLSDHPCHSKKNIVKGQMIRAARMTSDRGDLNEEMEIIHKMFKERGYPDNIILPVKKFVYEKWGTTYKPLLTNGGNINMEKRNDYNNVKDDQLPYLDSYGNVIKQWNDVSPTLGVISKEFQLSESPLLGIWIISTMTNDGYGEKIFYVDEYVKMIKEMWHLTFILFLLVLPKFEVLIETSPVYLLAINESIHGTITARYTYGKMVTGNATITLSLLLPSYMMVEQNKNITKSFEITGSRNFSFSFQEMRPLIQSISLNSIGELFSISATATELLTGISESVNISITVTTEEYNLQFVDYPTVFYPSLNYTICLKVMRYDNKPLSENETQNQVTVTVTKANTLFYHDMNKRKLDFRGVSSSAIDIEPFPSADETPNKINYTIPENGMIHIEIPVQNETSFITIEANFKNYVATHFVTKLYKSYSNAAIRIRAPSSVPVVGSTFELKLESNEPLKEAYYLVVSRKQTVDAGKVTSARLRLTPTNAWAPSASIIVFYIHSSGDIIHDVLRISLKEAFQNKVTLTWNRKQAAPSENVSLDISITEPMSLVGLLVVDKSSKLLANINDITADMVLNTLTEYSRYYFDENELNRLSMDGNSSGITHYFFEGRNEGNVKEGYPDSSIFEECIHTNFYYNEYGFENIKEGLMTSQKSHIRSYFPETWLWIDEFTGNKTQKVLDVTLPDCITTWMASAFVISQNLGLGFSTNAVQLEAFQSFFIFLNLPNSVIRGEQFILEVTIFNYKEDSLEVTVTLQKNESFDILSSSNTTISNQYVVTIPSQDGKTVLFPIKPNLLGELSITVKATSPVASDAITQSVLVKAEGIAQSYSQTLLLSLTTNYGSNSTSNTLNFTFPPDVVNGSQRAYVTVVGNILGPSITGLDSLIQLPSGCGEQNMINFAPGVYILKYLKVTKQLKADIQEKALNYMQEGYQTELMYKRQDGSFSAFGNSDPSGSTWLTAFVLRCFLQARDCMDIDKTVLSLAVQWLMTKQNPSGEFWEPGQVIHSELQGGHNGPITLTAYVLIAVLEDNEFQKTYENAISRAVTFLEQKVSSGIKDNYALSIATYALSLANSRSAGIALDQLNGRAIKRGGMQFWNTPSSGLSSGWQPRSTDIELAAYVLLSHFTLKKFAEGIPIMKWLSQQRNHLGGYSSTQDTIVALQALSQFATLSNTNTTSMTVMVTEPGMTAPLTFEINAQNVLEHQSQMLPVQQPMMVKIEASGNGTAFCQLNIFYSLKTAASGRQRRDTQSTEAFDLEITVIDDKDNIDHLTLSICTSFTFEGRTGMALLDVTLPSGFTLVQNGVSRNVLIKNVETNESKVHIYLDSINETQVCIDIPAKRNSKVANTQDGYVVVYDYYEPICVDQ